MKNKIFTIVLSMAIIFTFSFSAFAADTGSGTKDLDLTQGKNAGDLESDGYHWDNASGTLTFADDNTDPLAGVDNLYLADKAASENYVLTISCPAGKTKTINRIEITGPGKGDRTGKITLKFTGGGTFNFKDSINISSAGNIIVDENTTVNATEGINLSDNEGSAVVDVQGTLEAATRLPSAAVYCSSMKIGSKGKVIIGSDTYKAACGIELITNSTTGIENVFVAEEGAKLHLNCSDYGLMVSLDRMDIPDKNDYDKTIVLPEGFLPQDGSMEIKKVSGYNGYTQYALVLANTKSNPDFEYGNVDGAGIVMKSGYKFTSVPAGSWSKDSAEGLEFTADTDMTWLTSVEIDGNRLTQDTHYTVKSGSTVITLLPAYLKTLTAGNHNVVMKYTGGALAASFNVADAGTTPSPGPAPDSDPVKPSKPHVHHHHFGTEWQSDDSNHWHECYCGKIDGKSAHTFEWVVDKEATKNERGQKHQECTVCGHKLAAVETPSLGEIEYEHNQSLKNGVKNTKVSVSSKLVKNGIRLNWKKSEGYRMDGFEVYRSTKKNIKTGKHPFFKAKEKARTYKNTKKLKEGKRYYYRVRGYRYIDGEKVYTKWSNYAYRTYR